MPNDLKNLQGTWNITSLEVDGNPMGEAMFAESIVIVKGNKSTSLSMGAEYEGTLSLDEKKSPKTFDLRFTKGPEKGNTNYGIYELKGDNWKICLCMTGKDRPSTFATKPGTGHALETLVRDKSAKKVKSANAAAKAKSSATEKSLPLHPNPAPELEGEWAMTSVVNSGESVPAQFLVGAKRITKGNDTTVFMGGSVLMKARFSVDRTKSPNTIDYYPATGSGPAHMHGIFELDGKNLKLCFSAKGSPRPTDFSSKPGDGRTLTTFKFTKR